MRSFGLPFVSARKMASVQSSPFLFKKHARGQPLTSKEKQIILNVYAKLRQRHPKESIVFVATETAELTGVSRESVFAAKKEMKTANGVLRTPGKKRPKAGRSRTRLVKYDDFTQTAIRMKVHGMFRINQIPTLTTVMDAVNNDKDLPNLSLTTVHRLMKDLGFVYKKRERNSVLIERDDIIMWRRRYLRAVKQYRSEGRHIYYTDETWVNAGHSKSKVHHDTTVKTPRQAFVSGLTTGLKASKGKGGRLIITHAGSEDGFVAGACKIFRARKGKGDYHEEMDGNHYEQWFVHQLLPNIQPNSVIVIDNAPYHSVRLESIPTQASRKAVIQDWLTAKGIQWSADMLKVELLAEVARVKHKFETYRIDSIAAEHGHTVLRLPPYHCELNPIELIWSQVKGYVAANNTNFTMDGIQHLTPEAIDRVTPESWKQCVLHSRGEEEKMWDLDCLSDTIVDNLSFDINGSSDNDTDSQQSDGAMSGIDELPVSE